MNHARPSLGPLAAGIILLTLATSAIHFYLAPTEFEMGATLFGVLFVLNGLGYVTMLAVIYTPLGFLAPFRGAARGVLVVIALASIGAYFYVGVFDTLGWVDKVVEAALIVLVVVEVVTGGAAAKPAAR